MILRLLSRVHPAWGCVREWLLWRNSKGFMRPERNALPEEIEDWFYDCPESLTISGRLDRLWVL